MGRVLTNNTGFAFSVEDSLGVLAGTPTWKRIEPNGVANFGPTTRTVARNPINPDRQRLKGTLVDLDSAVEFEHDLTMEVYADFIEGFVFALAQHPSGFDAVIQSGALFNNLAADNDPPSVGTDAGFTHNAIASPLIAGQLVYSRGFTNAINNGLHVVVAGGNTTDTLVSTALVDEIPGNQANATVEIAGVRGATGDLQIDANGDLISTVLDFTTLGLTVPQVIHIGGLAAGNRFANAANFGFARITGVTTNLITLDKKATTFVVDAGGGQDVDILFGRFIRNVPVTDVDFIQRSYQFEAAWENLDDPGPGDEFEYSKGNRCNSFAHNLPLTEKALLTLGFVGTDTDPPTDTQETNAATPVLPVQTEALNTSADIARLRVTEVDEAGLTTDFKSITVTLANNVTPEKVLGQLGAKFLNQGNFFVDIETQVLFTSGAVLSAIRQNRTVTMDWSVRNNDSAIFVDIPAMTLGGGGRELPENESVLVNIAGQAFKDPIYGISLGVSLFPFVPAS